MKMVHVTANLVSLSVPPHNIPIQHNRKRLLQIFFCASLVLFMSAVTKNMDSDSTLNSTFPCGKCSLPVTDDHQGLQCDTCNIWFHAPCQRVGNMQYDYLSSSNCSWHCTKCDSMNYSLGSASDINSFASVNSFNVLHTPDKGFQPASSSTPAKSRSSKTASPRSPPMKVVHINFQSLREKKSQFFSFVELNKPDIIVGTETWLTKDMFDSEYFPPELGFTVYRRDRIGQKGGGVIILVKSHLSSEERSEYNSDCENLWVQLNLVGSKSVLIGAYYKPHEYDQHSLDELSKSLDMVKLTSSNVWLTGDFNLPKVDWQSLTPTPDCRFPTFYRECLEVFNDCLLEQTVTSPTRGKHILDLFFTSNPTLVDSVSIIPGLSDHDIVQVLINVTPSQTKQVPRDVPLYKKADWDQLKQSMREFQSELLTDLATTDVQEMWDKFASRLEQGIEKFIPTRKAGSRDGFPWITQEIRRLMRKRDKLYRRMKRSGRPNDTKKFQDYKHLVRRVTDRAYERYLGDILGTNTTDQEVNDPPKVNTKKLYSLLKHSKQDSSGVAPLKSDGKTLSDDCEKSNALNRQFQSVFSPKSPERLSSLAQRKLQELNDDGHSLPFKPSPFGQMPKIQISATGIDKLLKSLNPHKAAGPDQFKPIVLQTLHEELSPILQVIFQKSLDSGKLPHIWKDANVSPIFKKGDKSDPANYRPISLTCVLCKVLEHIVASNLTKHLTNSGILFELQHGFREKRSCETQLIMLVDEISKNMQMGMQTDLILLDFSKAFDKVAHEKLLSKLHYYGIRGETLNWVKDFLDSRSQAVVLNGVKSDKIAVSSGVPQGSVLGPILFLTYINDLPDKVKSRVRLFADDTAIYLAISSEGESITLQNDLHNLEVWEKEWDMSFNPSKCQVLHITRAKCPIQTKYILHGSALEAVSSAKYLGVMISDDLSWGPHIDSTSKKANQTLGFLKRNIKVHNRDLKSTAYTTLVRPQLEYASTVWSPHTAADITKLESVQRRAARWTTRDYQRTSSVTQMLKDLNWRTLEQRRIDSRLILMYKITYDLVAIPVADYLTPNTRQSRHNHQMAYMQIPTLKDYYKFTFFPRTIVHWNALPSYIPVLPTLAKFSHAVCQVVHTSP